MGFVTKQGHCRLPHPSRYGGAEFVDADPNCRYHGTPETLGRESPLIGDWRPNDPLTVRSGARECRCGWGFLESVSSTCSAFCRSAVWSRLTLFYLVIRMITAGGLPRSGMTILFLMCETVPLPFARLPSLTTLPRAPFTASASQLTPGAIPLGLMAGKGGWAACRPALLRCLLPRCGSLSLWRSRQ